MLYGLLAEFKTADALLEAVRRARAAGYRDLEAYAPFAVEGLAEALGGARNRVALWTLAGGVLGGVGTFAMQAYSAVVSYPINVGGRPLFSWPSFVPATFEIAILGAALAAVLSMLIGNGLPRLTHPIFGARGFDLASRNRFFLCVRGIDRQFRHEETRRFLASLEAMQVEDVEE